VFEGQITTLAPVPSNKGFLSCRSLCVCREKKVMLNLYSMCVCVFGFAALAARAGAEHIRPALQRLYMTRATAYRDALKSFVEGYQEGIAEVLAEKKKPTEHPGSTEAKDEVTERHNVHTSNSKP
jgi:hypothetical protein